MKDRIAEIRKKSKLSQQAFANRIGISREAVRLLENGTTNPAERTIRDICNEFNINREWLTTGKGKMEAPQPKHVSLDALAEAHNISDLVRAIIGGLGDMQPAHRDALVGLILDVGDRIRNANYDAAQPENIVAAISYDNALKTARVQNPPEEDLPAASEPHKE